MPITHVLAVAPVRDIDTSADWYANLLGRAADARPMDSLADFHLTESGWLQVFADPDRAGTAAVNFAVDDFDGTLADLRERGFDTSGAYGASRGVQLLPITDPDGNTVTFIGNVRQT